MSPTLLLKDGFKFFFYANEHLPRHVHVVKGDAYGKIDLTTLTFVENYLKAADAKRALAIASENRAEFEEKRDEFFKG